VFPTRWSLLTIWRTTKASAQLDLQTAFLLQCMYAVSQQRNLTESLLTCHKTNYFGTSDFRISLGHVQFTSLYLQMKSIIKPCKSLNYIGIFLGKAKFPSHHNAASFLHFCKSITNPRFFIFISQIGEMKYCIRERRSSDTLQIMWNIFNSPSTKRLCCQQGNLRLDKRSTWSWHAAQGYWEQKRRMRCSMTMSWIRVRFCNCAVTLMHGLKLLSLNYAKPTDPISTFLCVPYTRP
jgi:hypothetical protein